MPGDITACQGCGYRPLELLLDMGLQPPPEGSGARGRYPLRLVRCAGCTLVQLDYAVPPGELFAKDHPYSTGNSAALRQHYRQLTKEIAGDQRLADGDVVIDIGANDGTLLNSYPEDYGLRRIAVEPTDQGKKFGGTWYPFSFSRELAGKIRSQYGQAKVITACNVLAHVPDVHDFLDGVTELLGDDGVFVTENHDVHSIFSGNQVDTIYHEHLRYYSPASLARLLEDHGLHVEAIEPVQTHGGSFRTTARQAPGGFPVDARIAATALRALLYQLVVQKNHQVYGIGAATRATPLIHYAGIGSFINRVCEVSGSDKIGHKMPGTQVPVTDEADLIADQPAYALLFNWHMADVVVPKLRERGYKGKFIVPLPQPKVIEDA